MSYKITHIYISGRKIGLIGVHEVFDQVQKLALEESSCQEEILQRVKQQNYIPADAEAGYTEALWREFRRWRGEQVEDEDIGDLTVKVLGPGCYACEKMLQDLKELLTELNLAADVEHVRDLKRIGEFGLLATPALVINNKVKASGRAPAKAKLKEMIREALNSLRDYD